MQAKKVLGGLISNESQKWKKKRDQNEEYSH